MTVHRCPLFTEFPAVAPCGATRVEMAMDPAKVTCPKCVKKLRLGGHKTGKAPTFCRKRKAHP